MCDSAVACETTLPLAVVSVPRARKHLRAWLEAIAWPGPAGEDVVLATGEAVTNAIEHCSRDLSPTTDVDASEVGVSVRVEIEDGRRRLRVRVVDQGRWREPDTRRGRGFGIAFMFSLMEQVTIVRGDSGTEVTMLSAFVPSPEGPAPVRA